jgi:preprotein translocase subunit SecA
MKGKSLDDLEAMIIDSAHAAYERKVAELGDELMKRYERAIMLYSIDRHWRRHLTDLDVLREGIGLVAIAQRDPLVEYKREAFGMWEDLQDQIQVDNIRNIFRVAPPTAQAAGARKPPVIAQVRNVQAVHAAASAVAAAKAKPEPVKAAGKRPGRNDPCWCGSGKKYKDCHLKEDQMMSVNRG